ncbi:MAG: acetylxylan esterase [Actinophytocola sp.]|nr:acetylxylan esterase [Actinophytocola sp.]
MMRRTTSGFLAALIAATVSAPLPAVAESETTAAAVSSRYYEETGPHAVTVEQGGPDHTLYYPSDLGAGGTQHPVVIWGNGTGATPETYDEGLRHFASWGFVVAAANTTQAGSGKEMLAGARFLIEEDQRSGSVFYGKIDETRIGAAGHSQGGGGAIAAGADPIVDTTIPIQPGPQGTVGDLHGPAFFISGQFDWIVPSSYVYSRYLGADHVPAVFGELRGADHFFPGDTRLRLIGATTAWFRFHLMADENARGIFFGPSSTCGICTDTEAWSKVDRNAKAQAIPG